MYQKLHDGQREIENSKLCKQTFRQLNQFSKLTDIRLWSNYPWHKKKEGQWQIDRFYAQNLHDTIGRNLREFLHAQEPVKIDLIWKSIVQFDADKTVAETTEMLQQLEVDPDAMKLPDLQTLCLHGISIGTFYQLEDQDANKLYFSLMQRMVRSLRVLHLEIDTSRFWFEDDVEDEVEGDVEDEAEAAEAAYFEVAMKSGGLHEFLLLALELVDLSLVFIARVFNSHGTDIKNSFGSGTWAHLNTLYLDHCSATSSDLTNFFERHRRTLEKITLRAFTLEEGDYMQIWPSFLLSLRKIKVWKSVVMLAYLACAEDFENTFKLSNNPLTPPEKQNNLSLGISSFVLRQTRWNPLVHDFDAEVDTVPDRVPTQYDADGE